MLVSERQCRACASSLQSVLNLGNLALSSFPLEPVADLPKAPLDLCRCDACGLVQLRHTVEPDALFRQYWYHSGINETMRAELADIVQHCMFYRPLEPGDVVVDVGANDGTLLAAYPKHATRIAYEPADNLRASLTQHCDLVIPSYFPASSSLSSRSVAILTSIACFYAVDAPVRFVAAVDDVLTSDGIWIVQFQDLHQMLEATAFDDICFEHLFYPCLASVERLLAPFDLHIIDAQRRAINGGSLRLTIGRRWREMSPCVAQLRELEAGCEDRGTLEMFAIKVYEVRNRICQIVNRCSFAGKVIDLYGASTKGNTLLQVCAVGAYEVRQAWERSPEKWGRHTITGIPIVSEEAGRANPPDILLVGIWQFRDAIIKREEAFVDAGGWLLFPLPVVEFYP